jgi:hypothetical protein
MEQKTGRGTFFFPAYEAAFVRSVEMCFQSFCNLERANRRREGACQRFVSMVWFWKLRIGLNIWAHATVQCFALGRLLIRIRVVLHTDMFFSAVQRWGGWGCCGWLWGSGLSGWWCL